MNEWKNAFNVKITIIASVSTKTSFVFHWHFSLTRNLTRKPTFCFNDHNERKLLENLSFSEFKFSNIVPGCNFINVAKIYWFRGQTSWTLSHKLTPWSKKPVFKRAISMMDGFSVFPITSVRYRVEVCGILMSNESRSSSDNTVQQCDKIIHFPLSFAYLHHHKIQSTTLPLKPEKCSLLPKQKSTIFSSFWSQEIIWIQPKNVSCSFFLADWCLFREFSHQW